MGIDESSGDQAERDPQAVWAARAAAHPEDPLAHYNHAAACAEAGEHRLAIQALRRAIALKPDYGAAHYNLGSLLLESGEAAEAVPAFREAVKAMPRFSETHFMLGTAYAVAGDARNALAATLDGLKIAPEDPHGQANAGRSAFALGCYTDAALRYLLAVRLDHDNLNSLLCLGTCICRRFGIRPLELPVDPGAFDIDDPLDVLRLVLALWAIEEDDTARQECDRLAGLDAGLGGQSRSIITRETAYRTQLLALAEQAAADPDFRACEAEV
jgi:tetratricopeptide (TPR) repeat protein